MRRSTRSGRPSSSIPPSGSAGWISGYCSRFVANTMRPWVAPNERWPLRPGRLYSLGLMAATLANSGRAEEGEALLAPVRGDSYGGPPALAIYSLARGDNEAAADWVVKTVEQRFPGGHPARRPPVRAAASSCRRVAAYPAGGEAGIVRIERRIATSGDVVGVRVRRVAAAASVRAALFYRSRRPGLRRC